MTAPSARGSAAAGRTHDYPRLKLVLNRIVNAGVRMLFQHGYNDTTNAFKAYRRHVIDQLQPLTVKPLQSDRRDAAEGDRARLQLRRRADQLDEPSPRRVEAEAPGDGQPLPVHRPVRLARAPSQSRRLPPCRPFPLSSTPETHRQHAPERSVLASLRSDGPANLLADADRRRHRLRWPDRLGVRPPLRRGRLRRHRSGERHARAASSVRRPRPRTRRTRSLRSLGDSFRSIELDIRDTEGVDRVFAPSAGTLELVIHTAAQPSHDWAASDPHTDFTVNANGTLNLLESTRRHAPSRHVHLLLDQQGLRRPARTSFRWSSPRSGWSCPRTTATSRASTHRCRSTPRPIRCSASRRRRRICWCRSTAATSGCRRCASAAAA